MRVVTDIVRQLAFRRRRDAAIPAPGAGLALVAIAALIVIAAVIVTITAFSGVALADDDAVEIEIVDAPDAVEADEDVEMTVNVTNHGSDETTRTVQLLGDDDVVDHSNKTLPGGETTPVDLVWKGGSVPHEEERSVEPTVEVLDADGDAVVDADATSVTLLWSELVLRDLSANETEVNVGDSITLDATIRNDGTTNSDTLELLDGALNERIRMDGTESDEQSVDYDLADVDTEELTLAATETEVVTFENVTVPNEPGADVNYDLADDTNATVQKNDDTSVYVLQPATFTVDIESTRVDDTTVEVDAAIENEGDLADSQPVTLSDEDGAIETRDVTLAGGETTTESFTFDAGSSSFTRNVTVETELPDLETTRVTGTVIEDGPTVEEVFPGSVQGDEAVTVVYTAADPDLDTVSLVVTDPDGAETVNRTVDPGDNVTETFELEDPSEIVEGGYDVRIDVTDDFGRLESDVETNAFEAETVLDTGEVTFGEGDEYRSPAGDFVEISVDADGDAYVLIGGDREADEANLQNYLDVVHVSGGGTFVVNTRLVGTDRPTEDVYIPVDGEVTSYEHSIGADSEPAGPFEDVAFEDHRGNEVASTLAEFRDREGLADRGSPLQPDRYRLVASNRPTVMVRDDGVPDFRHPTDRSNLVLTPPEIGDVTTYVLPPAPADRLEHPIEEGGDPIGTGDVGSLLDDATERDTVARGDRLLVEVQMSGAFGALLADHAADHPTITGDGDGSTAIETEWIAELLATHEGVRIELEDSDVAGPNHPGSRLLFENVDGSDLHVLPDDTADQWDDDELLGDEPVVGGLYVVIDTRGDEPFDALPRDGDELRFEVAYESPPGERYRYHDYSLPDGERPAPFDPDVTEEDGLEHFPYFGASDTTVRTDETFVFEAERIEYRETDLEGDLIVPAESDGLIAGTTNVAPGSEVEIQLIGSDRPDPTVVTIEEVTIEDDGSFEVTEDLTAFEPGDRIEVEFYSPNRLVDDRLLDKRGARVVDDLDSRATFEIDDLAEEPTVTRGERLDPVQATIANTGEIVDRQSVEFVLAGETVSERVVTLEGGESTTLDLSTEFVVLDPGEYEYAVRTDDDERTGRLTITEPESEELAASDDDTTVSAPPDQADEPGEDDPEPDEEDGSDAVDPDDGDEPDEEDGPEEGDGTAPLLPVGTREALGGTTVVGATYLLGHWI